MFQNEATGHRMVCLWNVIVGNHQKGEWISSTQHSLISVKVFIHYLNTLNEREHTTLMTIKTKENIRNRREKMVPIWGDLCEDICSHLTTWSFHSVSYIKASNCFP